MLLRCLLLLLDVPVIWDGAFGSVLVGSGCKSSVTVISVTHRLSYSVLYSITDRDV